MPINELDFFKKGSCASATNVVRSLFDFNFQAVALSKSFVF